MRNFRSPYNSAYSFIPGTNRSPVFDDPDQSEDCCVCCCLVCTGIRYVLCCKKMSRACRVQLVTFWVTTFALTLGFLVAYVTYGTDSIEAISTDMRRTDRKISNVFCERVEISASNPVNAYVLPAKPQIDRGRRQAYNVSDELYVEKGEYKYRKFYLLSGSKLSISSCARSFSQMFIIEGKSNFKTWTRNKDCLSCFLAEVEIYSFSCSGNYATYEVNVGESTDYYVVFKSLVESTWVTADFSLDRTLYDVTDASQFCLASVQCEFVLDIKHNDSIVFQTLATKYIQMSNIQTSCDRRNWVFVLVFGSTPALFGVLLSVIIYNYCKEPENSNSSIFGGHYASMRTPLTRFEYPQPVTATFTKPPTYEDVVGNAPEQPPEYSEAQAYIQRG